MVHQRSPKERKVSLDYKSDDAKVLNCLVQINSEAEGKSNRKEIVFSELDKGEPGDH